MNINLLVGQMCVDVFRSTCFEYRTVGSFFESIGKIGIIIEKYY